MNQNRLKGGQKIPQKSLQKVLQACSRALKVRQPVEISVGFVSPSQMRQLNRTWRGKDRVTDVLSFALEQGALKGELIVSYEQARRQAKDMNHSTRDEVCFLLVHGILHLWGYDHEAPRDAKLMFPLQEKILRSLKIDARI